MNRLILESLRAGNQAGARHAQQMLTQLELKAFKRARTAANPPIFKTGKMWDPDRW